MSYGQDSVMEFPTAASSPFQVWCGDASATVVASLRWGCVVHTFPMQRVWWLLFGRMRLYCKVLHRTYILFSSYETSNPTRFVPNLATVTPGSTFILFPSSCFSSGSKSSREGEMSQMLCNSMVRIDQSLTNLAN